MQISLRTFGGHSQAAGFSLKPSNITAFKKAFIEQCESMIKPLDLIPKLIIDKPLNLSKVTINFINELAALEPFGEGNPKPVFMTKATLIDAKKVGKTQTHLKCRFEQNNFIIDAIGFSLGHKLATLTTQQVSIAFHVSINSYNGKLTPQLELIDIK